MRNNISKSQAEELDAVGMSIMGFMMGVFALGGIWFLSGFMLEIFKWLG